MPLFHLRAAIASVAHVPGNEWLLLALILPFELRLLPRASSRAPRLNAYRQGGGHCIGTSAQSASCLHVRGRADGQQGPGRRGDRPRRAGAQCSTLA